MLLLLSIISVFLSGYLSAGATVACCRPSLLGGLDLPVFKSAKQALTAHSLLTYFPKFLLQVEDEFSRL